MLKKDFLDEDAPEALRAALGGHPADVVLSDMAAPTTGHRQTDHLRTMYLCETAADFAATVLKPGGHFVAKVFRGGTEGELLARLKRDFSSLHHVKPPASRSASVELYLVALGFRGTRDHLASRLAALVPGDGGRPDISEPASGASSQNEMIEARVSPPTVRNAGQNTSAVIAPLWALVDSCSEIAPMVMPSDTAICCATLVMVVA